MSDQNNYQVDDEITLKELILKIGEFWKELWKYWWLIGAITLPIVIYSGYQAIQSEKTYTATITFMVNQDEGGSINALSGILGTFGLRGGSKGGYNLDKMLQLLKSRRITEEAIFQKIEINGSFDFLANHIINNLDLKNLWERKPSILNRKPDKLAGFRFKQDSLQNLTRIDKRALKRVFGKLIGTKETPGMLSCGYSEESGILNMSFKTQNESLSIALAENYYRELADFYTQKAVDVQKSTYDIVKAKNDSISYALKSAEYSLASHIEKNTGLVSNKSKLAISRLQREVQKLNVMYAESQKNLELADFTLRSKTPSVQIIDSPLSPISPKKDSLPKSLLIGGFLGVFLGALFVIGRKIYRDTMSQP